MVMALANLLNIRATLASKTVTTRKQRILRDSELANIDQLIGRLKKIA